MLAVNFFFLEFRLRQPCIINVGKRFLRKFCNVTSVLQVVLSIVLFPASVIALALAE